MATESNTHIGLMSEEDRKRAKFWAQTSLGMAGDVGPFTCWTTKRGKLVFIRRAPPDKPASARQLKQRLRFRAAWLNWQMEPDEVKQKWRDICDHASLCMSGHNLYMSQSMKPTPEILMHTAASVGITVELPPFLPA